MKNGEEKLILLLKDEMMNCDCEEYVNVYENEIAKEIVDLNDDIKRPHYLETKYKRLLELAREKNSLPLYLAILKKGDNTPEYIKSEIIKEICEMENTSIIASLFEIDNLTYFCYKTAYDKGVELDCEHFTNLLDNYCKLSKSAISSLCYMPIADIEKTNFICYKYITPDASMQKEIIAMLENRNEKFFKGEVSECFTTALVNNKNMPFEIQEKAFEIAFCEHDYYDVPSHFAKILYENSVEELFNENNLSFKHKKFIDGMISDFILENKLTEEQHEKFIDSYLSCGEYIRKDYTSLALLGILRRTANMDIIHKYLDSDKLKSDKSKTDKLTLEVISENKHLDGNTYKKWLSNIPEEIRDETFILGIKNVNMDWVDYEEFIEKKDSFINYFLVAELTTSPIITNKILNKTPKENLSDLFYIKELKHQLMDEILKVSSARKMDGEYKWETEIVKAILSEAVSVLLCNEMNKKDLSNSTINKLADKITETAKAMGDFEYIHITEEKYKSLMKILNDIDTKYIEQRKITSQIKKTIEEKYNKSLLFNKYPKIFDYFINKNENREYYVCRGFIFNTQELYNYTKEQKEQLIRDIKKEKDLSVLSDFAYKMQIALTDVNENEVDDLYKYIYEFADVYNVLDEKMNKLMKDTIKFYERNDTEER